MDKMRMPTRRSVIAGGLAATLLGRSAAADTDYRVTISDKADGRLISPYSYGCNEIGTMDGGPPSAEFDRAAGVTARRLGGNLMTPYNWVNNATNAGNDWEHANGPFLLDTLGVPRDSWTKPAVVVETMHETTLSMGAKSLVTVPLAGYVAADFDGPVPVGQTVPSVRFVPLRWSGTASETIDPLVADIPQFLARLIKRFGTADQPNGILGFALDNEPAIWSKTHPRLVPKPITISSFLGRSLAAARAIKALDPEAKVFGPVSWGATGMVDFQGAPDWIFYRDYGSFIAAYLHFFRSASEREGRRLLDVLDIHWYPASRQGDLFRTERPDLAEALLQAPRSLTEFGFRENSWVSEALPLINRDPKSSPKLGLPILPSLERLVADWFPGTKIAVTEFNYGGAGQIAAGLAIVDVLGRFGSAGVYFACHWGSLAGWLGEAYRLYRTADSTGAAFGERGLPVEIRGGPAVCAYAAASKDGTRQHLVILNKATAPVRITIAFASGIERKIAAVLGFDAAHPKTTALPEEANPLAESLQVQLPARSARRYAFV